LKGSYTERLLRDLKNQCDDLSCPYPKYFVVDDCCSSRKLINEVFPDAIVCQDIKHLNNRLIEETVKSHNGYSKFAESLALAVMGAETSPFTGKDGKPYLVKRPLDSGEEIWNRVSRLVASWKSQPSTNTLFKNGFDAALQNAKEHYLKCIPEVIVNGLHFVEYQNGKFAFYRGTNR